MLHSQELSFNRNVRVAAHASRGSNGRHEQHRNWCDFRARRRPTINFLARATGRPGAYESRARPPLIQWQSQCASQAVIIAGLLAGAAWKMLGFRCKKKQAPGRKLFCPARDPVSEPRGERPRPDLNTPDRRRGGSVQPAGDFRRGSASSSNPSEIELTRSGSDSKARSPFWGGASP